MNKKAMVYDLGLLIITFSVLLIAFVALSGKIDKFADTPIGKRQADLIRTYQRAETALFYIDQSAKLSAYQSGYDLAANGGYYNNSACGSYFGYSLWNNDSDKCYPNAKKDFSEFMKENLNSYASLFGLENSYIFIVNPNNIMGIALGNVEIEIEKYLDIMGVYDDVCDIPTLVDITGIACSSSISCEFEKKAFEKLKQANDLAFKKYGYRLQVTGAYRPFSVQKYWFEHGTPSHPEWAYKTSKIARPRCDSPHITGMSVDVVFKGEDMCSARDDNGRCLTPVYARNEVREKLEEIMCEVGFVRFGNSRWSRGEYWHYEYGTDRWKKGKDLGKCAII